MDLTSLNLKMCPAKTRDPRSYIQPIPLALPSNQGKQILARSDTQYKTNRTSTTNDEIFKANYARRYVLYMYISSKPKLHLFCTFVMFRKKLHIHSKNAVQNYPTKEYYTALNVVLS